MKWKYSCRWMAAVKILIGVFNVAQPQNDLTYIPQFMFLTPIWSSMRETDGKQKDLFASVFSSSRRNNGDVHIHTIFKHVGWMHFWNHFLVLNKILWK